MVSQNERPADATVTRRSWRGKVYDGAVAVGRFIETNPFIRLLGLAGALVGFIVLTLTGLQIREDLASRQEADFAWRQEERVARAWETLYRPVLGNSGKGQAINTLFRSGATLEALDISCGTMSGRSSQSRYCDMPLVISDLDLAPDDRVGEMFMLTGWKLDGVTITKAVIKSAVITGVRMNGATVMDSTFDAVRLSGELDRTEFLNVEITNSQITIDCTMVEITGNISGSTLTDEGRCLTSRLNRDFQVWAWANSPPAFIAGPGAAAKPFTNVWYCDPRKPKPATVRNDQWAEACDRLTDSEARQAFPNEWQQKFGQAH